MIMRCIGYSIRDREETNWLLQAPPVKPKVGGMCEGRDWGVNEIPGGVAAKLTLLTHTHAAVWNLLHNLGELLGRAGLCSD